MVLLLLLKMAGNGAIAAGKKVVAPVKWCCCRCQKWLAMALF
jgi:hypothetical protein